MEKDKTYINLQVSSEKGIGKIDCPPIPSRNLQNLAQKVFPQCTTTSRLHASRPGKKKSQMLVTYKNSFTTIFFQILLAITTFFSFTKQNF